MKQKVTLSEIARRAGVATATAAKVISGNKSNIRVSAAKSELIRRIAEELNYRPNFNARQLAGRASRLIGILIETNAPETNFRMLGDLERIAARLGYRCMIGEFSKHPLRQKEQYDIFMQYGVDGVICMPSDYLEDTPEFSRIFSDALSNTVFIDNPGLPDAAWIHIDRKTVMKEAVFHLHRRGARKIAQVRGLVPYRSSLERKEGYLEAMRELGYDESGRHVLEIDAHFTGAGTSADAERIVREYVRPLGLDALMMSNDLYALAMLRALRNNGLRVPEDVRIVGYNNNEYCSCTSPSLTTVDDRLEEQAERIVELLLRKVAPDALPMNGCQGTVVPELIVREST